MAEGKIFVGRKAELEQFKELLKDPKGQAVLVVGQAGMGKTWLVNEIAEIAESHTELKCGWVRYEVTPTDSVDSTMALMMDNAFEAAQVTEGSFNGTTRRLEQWKSFLNVINIGDLVMSLKRDPAKNTREQFLKRLRLISKRMTKNGRAIFVIDPEKYMQEKSDQSWAIVVKQLPEKIKFVFAQRPEDVLVESETFGNLGNISHIPEKRLDILDEEAVDDLLNQRVGELKYSVTEVREVLRQYNGHPYALQGSLDLLKAGTKLEELPKDPTGIAVAQLKELSKRGKEAIRLFKAYAILEVGVPNEVVKSVSELDTDTVQSLLADNYIGGLLREEGEGKRIYHAILADCVLEQIGEDEKKQYHSRAVEVYRGKLSKAKKEQIKPDALAAKRLAEHILEAEGKEALVDAFVNEVYPPLKNLGLLDVAISLSERALCYVKKRSIEEANVLGNMGVIYKTKGELHEAVRMFLKCLEIHKELGSLKNMANDYANLGIVYGTKGDLCNAVLMHQKALDIDKRLGNLKGMATQYGNLGSIYQRRGSLDKSESMQKKALKLNEKLNELEGMALQYGNLGQIYRMKGDLNKAEEMNRKSLQIGEKMGLKELISRNYADFGIIYLMRGNLGKAEDMLLNALEIDQTLGRLEGMASVYGNLGNIYLIQGELVTAEEMYLKSLEISETGGMMESTANQYSNLGSVYKKRGNINKAKEYWEKALELYKKMGMTREVEKVEGWIEGIED